MTTYTERSGVLGEQPAESSSSSGAAPRFINCSENSCETLN